MKLVLFLFYLSLFPQAWGMEEKPFSPHMIDHKNKGCPTNSYCEKETGIKRNKWLEALKDKGKGREKRLKAFVDEHGLLFSTWARDKFRPGDEIIYWDSHCPNHRKEGVNLLSAQLFVKSLDKKTRKGLQKRFHDALIFEQGYLLGPQGKIRNFIVPKGEVPVYLDGNQLIFIREEEGDYYNLKISSSGELGIEVGERPKRYPREVSCPKKLIQHLSEENQNKAPPKELYKSYYCKQIWSPDAKKSGILLLPHSCL